MLHEQSEIARRDMVSRMEGALREGKIEGKIEVARNLLEMNVPPDKIAAATGLARDELKALQKLDETA